MPETDPRIMKARKDLRPKPDGQQFRDTILSSQNPYKSDVRAHLYKGRNPMTHVEEGEVFYTEGLIANLELR